MKNSTNGTNKIGSVKRVSQKAQTWLRVGNQTVDLALVSLDDPEITKLLKTPAEVFKDENLSQIARLGKEMRTPLDTLKHGVVGAAGEVGELLDGLKKSWVYEKPYDRENVVEELGDTEFYLWFIAIKRGLVPLVQKLIVYGTGENPQEDLVDDVGEQIEHTLRIHNAVSDLIELYALLKHFHKTIPAIDLQIRLEVFQVMDVAIALQLSTLLIALGKYAVRSGIAVKEYRKANFEKLEVRYSSGKYSNKQAAKRADKAG